MHRFNTPRLIRPIAWFIGAALCITAIPAQAQAYKLVQGYETTQRSDGGSSGSSQGHNTWVERVAAVRPDGIELVFDLPEGTPSAQRAQTWQFPVRVFRPAQGPMELLNRAELEARVDAWLKAAKLDHSACGRWLFTWTAMRIGCDPALVLTSLRALDWRAVTLAEGAAFTIDRAQAKGTLTRTTPEGPAARYSVTLAVDAEATRRERAEGDVIVGEITGKPVTLASALAQRATEKISGTMQVTLEADLQGQLARRTVVTTLDIVGADGRQESVQTTETLERLKRP